MSNNIDIKMSQYLTFHLEEEMFTLSISQVREVLDFTSVTKIPRTPDFMRGVINLRGNVVPIIDLRLKFGMTQTEKTIRTRIIIIDVEVDNESTILGILADSVEDVIDLNIDQIVPSPKIGTRLRTEFMKGMGKYNEQFIIILDIDKVFSVEELTLVQGIGEEPTEEV